MKNVLMIGQFTDVSGYGNAARNYLDVLSSIHDETKIDLKIINFSFEKNSNIIETEILKKHSLVDEINILYGNYKKENLEKIEYYINNKDYDLIFFLTNDWIKFGNEETSILNKNILNLNLICKKAKNLFPCVVWETDKAPQSFLDSYNNIFPKKLICACDWNSQVFEKETGIKSVTVPYYVNPEKKVDDKFKQQLLKMKQNKIAFCSVSQWSNRKGFDKLIKAFLLQFYDNENVCLFIKTYINKSFINSDESNFFRQEIEKIKNSITNYGNKIDFKCKIILLNQILKEEEINAIYDVSDFYITATKGEGFGLPIAEFITFKKPVCVPNKGGHLDFVDKNNFFIESTFEPCEGLNNAFYSTLNMNYVECSISSIKQNLDKCYNTKKNQEENYKEIGDKSFMFLKNYLSFEEIKNKFINILEV